MDFVRLCTVDSSIEANFIQGELEENGIESFLTNENFSNMVPSHLGLFGAGIQIMINKEDLGKATELLEEKKKKSEPDKCPNCSSTRISFGLGAKNRTKRLITILLSVIHAVPLGNIKNVYYCSDCGAEFSG